MICKLPSRSKRRYRGKYPTRVNSWAYSRSSSQKIVAKHLSMNRPVHIELNNGSRYVAELKYLIDQGFDGITMGADLHRLVSEDNSLLGNLNQDRYDLMLVEIRQERKSHGAA